MLRLLISVLLCCFLLSCKKLLDQKPDKSWATPSVLEDLSLTLDFTSLLNIGRYPNFGQQSCDDYYLTNEDWESTTTDNLRNNYIWQKDPGNIADWSSCFTNVPNNVLYELEKFTYSPSTANEWNRIKGSALFHRSYGFYEAAQVFCKAYDKNTAEQDLGIPLRINADYKEVSTRATVAETYRQILLDLTEAAALLPVTPLYKTRPSKPAAFALLARTYLSMQEYDKAGKYADSCLQLYNSLMDYNALNANSAIPIKQFNDEVMFHVTSSITAILSPSKCKVDSNLYRLYDSNDLRRPVYFTSNGNGTYAFKGGYDGQNGGRVFKGLATDEMYLIRAEYYARAGQTAQAMQDLNTLMIKRLKTGLFVPFNASSAKEALDIILRERRKEILFRSLRWTDLRRLNKEPSFATTLTRVLNGKTYVLQPNSNEYVSLIPAYIISFTNMPQNER